jgi:hypothetical protein
MILHLFVLVKHPFFLGKRCFYFKINIFLAACSIPALPPKTIKSAIETLP